MENEKLDAEKLVQLRKNTKIHLLQNPNYFGTLKEQLPQYEPVEILGNFQSYYEELGCIGYKPETRSLGAVIVVKQDFGYTSDACAGGSREYVRFFVDYENNNTWIDEGLAEVGVYNRPFSDDFCYYAQITLSPDKVRCCQDDAVLPNVRAILSWNTPPTAGDPNYNFVWGDVKEARVQIGPRNSFWCYIKDVLINIKDFEVNKQILMPEFEDKYLTGLKDKLKVSEPQAKPTLTPIGLKRQYGEAVSESRIAHTTITQYLQLPDSKSSQLKAALEGFNINDILDFYLFPNFNTDFEELHCVSLNRDLDTLHASVQVKRQLGYSGGLCTTGSKEYVAFYMDFGSGWQYMGTGSTPVHDIPNNPADGLWYDVELGINIDQYRKEWCQVSKAKLKGILSWNSPPTPNDPDYIASYGDWAECEVEIKPLPAGATPGATNVVLEKVGGMVVDDITGLGLATTNFAGSLGGAIDSPFYGTIELIGHIFFPLAAMSYRFLVTKPGGVELPLTDSQTITTDTAGVFSDVVINPDASGWMPYLQTASTNIVGGLLGRYYAYQEGLHSIRIQAKDAVNNIYDDVNGATSILIDATAPDVHINIDPAIGGDCGDYTIGTDITGDYTMIDSHAGSLSVSVTPADLGATVTVNGTSISSESYPGTLSNGYNSGTFVINTASAARCGYNIRIDAWDRTIVNSHSIGLYSNDIKGFCLRELNNNQ